MRSLVRLLLLAFLLALGPWPPNATAQSFFEPVDYVLLEGSTFQEGCFAPCMCPIIEPQTMQGTFVLQRLPSQGPLDLFAVGEIDWLVPSLGKEITGDGWYQRGGAADPEPGAADRRG
jgi:hypothetical protein